MPNYVFCVTYDPRHVGKRTPTTELFEKCFGDEYASANIQEIPPGSGIRWLFENALYERELYSASPRKRLKRGTITTMTGHFRNNGYWLIVETVQSTRGISDRRR